MTGLYMENQNQPESSLGQIPQLHKRNFRSFWPIVIIAALSAIVGGLIVYIAHNQSLDAEISSLLPGTDRKIRNSPSQAQLEVALAGWQTYRNEEYGFEFKYPESFKQNKIIDSNTYPVLNYEQRTGVFLSGIQIVRQKIESSSPGIEILVYKNSLDLADFLQKFPQFIRGYSEKKEIKAADESFLFFSGPAGDTMPDQMYMVKKADFVYQINFLSGLRDGGASTALPLDILSTFKFIEDRILLTPENRSQYNKFGNDEEVKASCEIKFNFDQPNTTVIYSSKKWGFSFAVPFNNNWGNKNFRLNPFDETISDATLAAHISYGPIGSFEGCGWSRDESVTVLKKQTAQEILADLNKSGDYAQLTGLKKPEIVKINGLEVVKYEVVGLCHYPIMVVIGKNYNYQFSPLCAGEFKDVEARVKTVKLIE